jgi:hypothetical protein
MGYEGVEDLRYEIGDMRYGASVRGAVVKGTEEVVAGDLA